MDAVGYPLVSKWKEVPAVLFSPQRAVFAHERADDPLPVPGLMPLPPEFQDLFAVIPCSNLLWFFSAPPPLVVLLAVVQLLFL